MNILSLLVIFLLIYLAKLLSQVTGPNMSNQTDEDLRFQLALSRAETVALRRGGSAGQARDLAARAIQDLGADPSPETVEL